MRRTRSRIAASVVVLVSLVGCGDGSGSSSDGTNGSTASAAAGTDSVAPGDSARTGGTGDGTDPVDGSIDPTSDVTTDDTRAGTTRSTTTTIRPGITTPGATGPGATTGPTTAGSVSTTAPGASATTAPPPGATAPVTTTTQVASQPPVATPAPTSPPEPPVTTESTEPTVTDPATTVPPATEGAPVLRGDGIGDSTFGEPVDAVLQRLGTQLGVAVVDETMHYPIPVEDWYETEDGFGFATEFGRTICFENALCAYFGGAQADALAFIGYDYAPDPIVPPVLSTGAGVQPGSVWAQVATVIEVFENGCYGTGYGITDGIDLELLSEESWFGSMGEEDPPVSITPDPAEVVITAFFAGESPWFVLDDC